MSARKALASLAALGLVLGAAATPAMAQDEEALGFWLTSGAVVGNILVITLWATDDDDIQIIPDPEPTPVSP